MSLDPSPKPVYFQNVAVGERFHFAPTGKTWFEKIRAEYAHGQLVNVAGQDGKKYFLYPLEEVYRK